MKYDCYYIEGVYSIDERIDISEKSIKRKNINLKDSPAIGTTKTSNVSIIRYGDLREELERCYQLCLNMNKHFFGFDIFEISDLDTVAYAEYHDSNNGEYDWHVDAVRNEPYDLKLTALLDLSTEPYEGGDFLLFSNGEQKISGFIPGGIIIFPSWIPHKVSPVTSGTRKSMALFLSGPSFK